MVVLRAVLLAAAAVAAAEAASLCTGGAGCKFRQDTEQPRGQNEADDLRRENLEVTPPPEERERLRSEGSVIHPWPNAEVPYAVWGADTTKEKVETALSYIEQETCVNFTKRDGQARYLLIKEGDGGCWTSMLGYPSSDKKVTVNLGPGCVHGSQIRHEVMHALGFPHEHTRPDRGDYVSIKWANIKESAKSQYYMNEKYPTMEVPYDLHSIMHYGKFDFAVNKSQPTMVPSPWVDGRLGGDNLSWRDKRKINIFYKCP
ncbi:hatching enzyme 1.2-like [Penaeus japonicus]|uniref:hatching enzyme 1.2-like n=1 Tax=Penaeus japonicus TaxID=27405 RepID=UPI001C711739|nr:hatching enzyme 1.2-like [Penaeus japonicus]